MTTHADGLFASRLQLPPGAWATVFEALCAHFPRIAPELWRARLQAGRVLDSSGSPLPPDFRRGRGLLDVYA